MKTRLTIILAVLFTLGLVLGACAPQGAPVPQDPLEAVKTIADKQTEVKSQHIDLALDLSLQVTGLDSSTDQNMAMIANLLKDFKANLTVSGDVDNAKNDVQFNGKFDLGKQLNGLLALQGIDKQEFDLVKVGDKLYTRLAGQDWNTTDTKASGVSADTSITATQVSAIMAQILKKAAKAEKLNDETISGADSYHYKVTLNPVDMLTEVANIASATGNSSAQIDQAQLDQVSKFLKDSIVEVELWAGKNDLLVRQTKVHFNLNLKDVPEMQGATALFDLVLTNTASKINEPVTITAPK